MDSKKSDDIPFKGQLKRIWYQKGYHEGMIEAFKLFDLELEAWMAVHDEHLKSFSSTALMKHMRKALLRHEKSTN